MGSEGPAVQAHSTWCSERHVVRPTGIVADLTVPVVRAAVARRAVTASRSIGYVALAATCRPSEIELFAGDPDAMHDHGKLASHGNGGALHAPTLGDRNAPSAQAGPLASTRHQCRCGLIEKVTQHSIAALADLS